MTHQQTLVLTNEIAMCCGGVSRILEKHYKLERSELDNAIFENYAFLLAYLCHKGGIRLDEACNCIACFVGTNCGSDTRIYTEIGESMFFYGKLLSNIETTPNDMFFISSIIIHNLLHPFLRDDFSKRVPIEEMNFLIVLELTVGLKGFLHDVFPKRINPILEHI